MQYNDKMYGFILPKLLTKTKFHTQTIVLEN